MFTKLICINHQEFTLLHNGNYVVVGYSMDAFETQHEKRAVICFVLYNEYFGELYSNYCFPYLLTECR